MHARICSVLKLVVNICLHFTVTNNISGPCAEGRMCGSSPHCFLGLQWYYCTQVSIKILRLWFLSLKARPKSVIDNGVSLLCASPVLAAPGGSRCCLTAGKWPGLVRAVRSFSKKFNCNLLNYWLIEMGAHLGFAAFRDVCCTSGSASCGFYGSQPCDLFTGS